MLKAPDPKRMRRPILEGISVSKHFGALKANDDVTIRVESGQIVGLIGPNGSGKTTFFNCVAGNHPPDEGRIMLAGVDITGLKAQHIARLGIIRTFQQTRTYLDMTCEECLMISAPPQVLRLSQLYKVFPEQTRQAAHELLVHFRLGAMAERKAGDLSFGQRRLLEIAMAVMKAPRILLLDEPTAGINPQMIAMLVELMRDLARERGIALLVIEHNVPVVMDIADRVYCMSAGRILAEGSPEAVTSDPRVLEAYLGAPPEAVSGIQH